VLDVSVRGLKPSSERDLSPPQRSQVPSSVPRLTALDDDVPRSERGSAQAPASRPRRKTPMVAGAALVGAAVGIAFWVGRGFTSCGASTGWRSAPAPR